MCLPSSQEKKLAATESYGFSTSLIQAKADFNHSSITAWALVILCTSSFYLGPLLLLSPLALSYFHPQVGAILFCTSLFLAFHPISPWPRFRRWCQVFYSVFNFHHNLTPKLNTKELENDHLSIIAMHPHAIIPLHGYIWGAICDQIIPSQYGYGCATDIALRLPVLRHTLHYLQTGPADKNSLIRQLQVKERNLFILPGGVAEIFLSRRRRQSNSLPFTQTIKAKRYGLMKLALQTGARIFPSFVFGASDMLDQLTPVEKESNSKANGIGLLMQSMSRKIKGGLALFYGQFYLPIPSNPKLTMVLGNPIYPTNTSERNANGQKVTCKRIANPTKEQVEELMDRYTDALHRLFEQYKVEAGYPNDKLVIT
jgi:diacylglycerol O-acyltransferase 2-like protein 3